MEKTHATMIYPSLDLIPGIRGRRGLVGGITVIRTRSWGNIPRLTGVFRLLGRVLLRLLRLLRGILLRQLRGILLWLLRILSRFLVVYYAWGTTSRVRRRGKEIDLMDRRIPNAIATKVLEDGQSD